MTSRVIATETDRQLLLRLIQMQKIPFTVEIVKGKRRSVEQNRLQRLWIGEIAEQLEDQTPEEIRAYCKLTLGVPILRAESASFCEKYDKHVRPLPYEQKLAIMAEPLDLPVTRLMTTNQKTRYLDAICKHFAEKGVALTQPEDIGKAAGLVMSRRQP